MFKRWFSKKSPLSATQIMSAFDNITDLNPDIRIKTLIDGINIQKRIITVSICVPKAQINHIPDIEVSLDKALRANFPKYKRQIIATVKKDPTATQSPLAPPQQPKQTAQQNILPHVKKIIAVASGKGGVGKSTLASNIAVIAAKTGLNVGLLDADIYGPSIPMMFGVSGKPEQTADEQIKPFHKHGIDIMSIGFMVEADAPMIWRGPMVQSALLQLMRDVAWGTADNPLDVLFIDMPPGTGDAQLTLAQKVPLSGAIIISTPQDIALIDARKGLKMFEQTKVPILGIVENMAFHTCSECGHIAHIFGENGAKNAAINMGVPFLGAIPLMPNIRLNADQGTPASLSDETVAPYYSDIVKNVLDSLANCGKKPPIIEIVE